MSRNIIIENLVQTPIEEQAIELVERKGVGHPDSIADGISEAVSRALSKSYVVGEVGIDFVYDKDYKPYVLEVNTKPGRKGLKTLREWVPTDEHYIKKYVIPFEYDNLIRKKWGRKLRNFLAKPLLYSKYLHETRNHK